MVYALAPNESPCFSHEQKIFQLNPPLSSDSEESIELSPINLSRTYSSSQTYSDTSHHKNSAIHLSQRLQEKQRTPRGRAKGVIRNIWLTAFLPAVAFAYLSFCYVVATRVVPVKIYKIEQPVEHLYEIKAGVTTLSIMIIAATLLPVKSLLDDLKGEEFFRRLHASSKGVPLEFVNNVSTPSHSVFQGIPAVLRAQATKYYAGTVLSGLIATAVASLAPAALSVGVIPVDGHISAFRVGAVGKNDIYVTELDSAYRNPRFTLLSAEASSMGWVQTTLGVDMTFRPLSYKHAVPMPLDLKANSRARWVSDVIIMDPVCTWQVPDPPLFVPPESWTINGTYEVKMNISLPTYNVGAQVYLSYFGDSSYSAKGLDVLSIDSAGDLFNLTTKDPPTQGTMAWLISQCTSCDPLSARDPSMINFTGIPHQEFKYPIGHKNLTEATSLLSVLVCEPRATIESREIRADGSGRVEVVESQPLVRQGNLHNAQTRLLLTKALTKYSTDSGPGTSYDRIGKAAQIQMFFGKLGNSSETPILTPLPIGKLTEGYALAQQAAMHSYLSGRMSWSFVPGRIQNMTLVFTSSLPHVIVSTILFAFLTLFINICYLRTDTEQFTLLSVAAALAHSNVPNVCEDIRYADGSHGAIDQAVVLQSLRGRRVYLTNNGGPGESLRFD